MKKLLCILLSCILVFNSLTVVYADEHGGSGGSFDPLSKLKEEHPDLFDENGHMKPSLTQSVGSKLFDHMIVPDLIKGGEATVETLASLTGAITEFFNLFDNSNDDVSIKYKDNGQPVTENNYNENNFYITYSPKFLKGLNDNLQEKVHALDGYFLFEPPKSLTFQNVIGDVSFNSDAVLSLVKEIITDGGTVMTNFSAGKNSFILRLLNDYPLYFDENSQFISSWDSVNSPNSLSGRTGLAGDYLAFNNTFTEQPSMWGGIMRRAVHGVKYNFTLLKNNLYMFYGNPFKVFYSLQDAKNYINNGKKLSYAPKLPSTNVTIPLAYVNGTLNLPDFNINLDSLVGKAELEIQNDIDNQFKLYLDKLAEININPSQPTTPTPTPSGGGSGGDFGDGTTPTPAPDFTDGLKDTNDYLKQILEKVTSILQVDTDFSKSFETVSQNLCKYLESNNEKLDQIITAINALSNGKTEDEVNGCKYDFTQLSQSLTSLWNDSDQKFDQMIKLLEENNKYQEKIIGDLNDIKAILIAQTVLDAFQNRSKETADKAKEKFPTSIPWDIAMIVNTFSAEPEPIKFELPIKVNSLNINETITVDLSTGEWEKLGKLCRYMLSVLFILFLIQLSRKLFSNGGDE